MSERKLEGQTAVVTGSARGLGVALARQFARDGANLVLADKNAEALPALADEFRDAHSVKVSHIAANLADENEAQGVIDQAMDDYGRVDILINNAGGGIIRPFLEHTPDTLRETVDRNLWTTLWCIRAVLPKMLAAGYGRIVNISADSVHTGIWSHAGYNAAKGGVNGVTTGLAFEFAKQNITVNCVSPGGIATPELLEMFNPNSEVYKKHQMIDINKALEHIPNGRLTELDEVAALTAFLTYKESMAITGQIYSINGGQWMM